MQDSPLIEPRELQFQLFEVLDALALTRRERHAEHSRETFEAAVEAAHEIALREFLPHNRLADEHEPRWDGQRVQVLPEVQRALRAFCDAGFTAADQDAAEGGMQLPVLLTQACLSLFKSANTATTSYVGLTMANANVIARFGTASQRHRYLHALRSGRFFGTMALTEPKGDRACRTSPPLPRRCPMAASPSRARRCSSRAAITSSARTSCTWCWRALPVRRRA